MIEGGPCAKCGATQASIWYGKRVGDKYCKKAECMREGGYLAPTEGEGGQRGGQARARSSRREG